MNKSDIKKKINDLFIVREDDGSYNLFGKYFIRDTEGEYLLKLEDDEKTYKFYTLRHAVTYCVLANSKNYKGIRRVLELDNELVSLDAAIENHTRLINKADIESKHIYMAKLCEEKRRKRKVLEEINEYASLSKHIQRRKYKENTDL